MKMLLAGAISMALIAAAPGAYAGNRYGHHGYYGGHGYGHGYGGHYYRHKHGNGNNNDEVAYLIGGLVVGGLLTNAYYKSRPVYQPATVQRSYAAPAAGQRLVRDANGACFTSEFDSAGTEYRTAVDPALCNW